MTEIDKKPERNLSTVIFYFIIGMVGILVEYTSNNLADFLFGMGFSIFGFVLFFFHLIPSTRMKLLNFIQEKTKGSEHKATILLGKILRPIFYITVGIWGYSFLANNDISRTPLGGLTLSDIGGFVSGIIIIIFAIRQLFSPPHDDEHYKVWGSLVYIILIIIFIVWLISLR